MLHPMIYVFTLKAFLCCPLSRRCLLWEVLNYYNRIGIQNKPTSLNSIRSSYKVHKGLAFWMFTRRNKWSYFKAFHIDSFGEGHSFWTSQQVSVNLGPRLIKLPRWGLDNVFKFWITHKVCSGYFHFTLSLRARWLKIVNSISPWMISKGP